LTTSGLFVTVAPMKRRKMTPADFVIFTGIAVNVVVIGLIVYYFVL
jgi:ASC-1-like (ASCH) protein